MLELLKRSETLELPKIVVEDESRRGGASERIRCPQCEWAPDAGSLWSCDCHDTPEPPFRSCGTMWHTFSTHGQCPGCGHQWLWTSCLACGEASRHDDWYEVEEFRSD